MWGARCVKGTREGIGGSIVMSVWGERVTMGARDIMVQQVFGCKVC